MGNFSPESLAEYNELCQAGGESLYDFTMCVKPDGTRYGVPDGKQCKGGRPVGKFKEKTNKNLSKLTKAFRKKKKKAK